MNSEDKSKNIVILPYKDAFRNSLFEPEDVLKWLENENIKDDFDNCLDNLKSS
ncbi:MAG: hypothetical protein ACFFDK_15890 [Promethearchaeota archaeon]